MTVDIDGDKVNDFKIASDAPVYRPIQECKLCMYYVKLYIIIGYYRPTLSCI